MVIFAEHAYTGSVLIRRSKQSHIGNELYRLDSQNIDNQKRLLQKIFNIR